MFDLERFLAEISGMDWTSLTPCAGAHGEFTGLLIIDKYHKFQYDNKHRAGKVTEFKGVDGGKGSDGIWLTADDIVTSAKECFYNKNGTKDKEKKYIGPGPDGKWFSKDDVIQYYTVFHYVKKPKTPGRGVN